MATGGMGSLVPRPSLTAFTAAKKAVREGLGTRLRHGHIRGY